jgi:hypothetical protein
MARKIFFAISVILLKSTIVFLAILFLLWHFAPKNLIYKKTSFEISPSQEREIFRVLSDSPRFPKFIAIFIEPKDIKPGKIQKITLQIEDPSGIESVLTETEIGNKTIRIPLKLINGDDQSGYWTNAWILPKADFKKYKTKISATNKNGNTNTIALAWSDECKTPLGGDWIVNFDCSISSTSGADNGDINFENDSTLTIKSGGVLVFNPERKINLSNGKIVIEENSHIKQTYIWITDADGDNYAPSGYKSAFQDSRPQGYSRRANIIGTNDINDYDPKIH